MEGGYWKTITGGESLRRKMPLFFLSLPIQIGFRCLQTVPPTLVYQIPTPSILFVLPQHPTSLFFLPLHKTLGDSITRNPHCLFLLAIDSGASCFLIFVPCYMMCDPLYLPLFIYGVGLFNNFLIIVLFALSTID